MKPDRVSERYSWISAAKCRGVELEVFFPLGQNKAVGSHDDEAKLICASCPVVSPCREWALRVAPEFGIFGGLTPDERRTLRNPRRTASARPATPTASPEVDIRF